MVKKKVKKVEEEKDKSELGITVKKLKDFSEWYTQVIKKAGLIEYSPVSGCMVIRPYAYSIWECFQDFFNKEIKKIGVENAYFPLFIPEGLLKKEQEHVQGFTPEVAWVTMHGETKFDERLAVRPTSETIMYDSYAKWIRSYKDLPLKINQWCSVVRWEFKHPVPFLRTREFLWQEGHTAFASRDEAETEVMNILEIYARAYEELFAIPVLRGRKSDSEKFAGAVYTLSVETLMPNGKAVQGATSHYLGQNFSKAFNISYLGKDSKRYLVHQNSWGFSTRSLGIMLSVHGDDMGLVLPPRVAPKQVVIVPIIFSNTPTVNEKVMTIAREVEKNLSSQNIRVYLDDREEYSPGFKFNYWEMRGVPLRIEIGPKDAEKGHVVLIRRDSLVKESLPSQEAGLRVVSVLAQVQDTILSKARSELNARIVNSLNFEEVRQVLADSKVAFAPWCGAKSCESKVNELGAKSLNIPFEQPKNNHNCFVCDKPSKFWSYFAKSY